MLENYPESIRTPQSIIFNVEKKSNLSAMNVHLVASGGSHSESEGALVCLLCTEQQQVQKLAEHQAIKPISRS